MQKEIFTQAQPIWLAPCNWLANVCAQSKKSVKKCWAASQLTIISWKSSQLKRLSEWVKEIYRERAAAAAAESTIHYIISGRVTEWIGYLQREVQRQPPLYHAQCGFYRLPIHPVQERQRERWRLGLWGRKKTRAAASHREWKERRWWREKWQSLR